LADAPVVRKRAVPAGRPKAPRAAAQKRTARPAPAPRPVLEDEPPSTNYALRLTEGIEDEEPTPLEPPDTFALRLSEALEAINAHHAPPPTPEAAPPPKTPRVNGWLASLDKLPPIRLPIGPAIPWRIGLPLLLALVVGMGLMSRVASQADPQGVKLPAQQTYPAQDAPLFATPVAAQPTPEATPQTQPIGVSDSAASAGFDLGDIAIKLIAVLGLIYASLMLLKRFGVGGMGGNAGGASNGPDVRVLSSIALAPNRSVHVIQVPGKTLLVGATPTSVNLLTELDDEPAS